MGTGIEVVRPVALIAPSPRGGAWGSDGLLRNRVGRMRPTTASMDGLESDTITGHDEVFHWFHQDGVVVGGDDRFGSDGGRGGRAGDVGCATSDVRFLVG